MHVVFWSSDSIAVASFGVTLLSAAAFKYAARFVPWEIIAAAVVAGGLLLAWVNPRATAARRPRHDRDGGVKPMLSKFGSFAAYGALALAVSNMAWLALYVPHLLK